MTIDALSLFGFMESKEALAYLQQQCVFKDTSRRALEAAWMRAKKKLGAPNPEAGKPEFRDIPPEDEAYCRGIMSHPRFVDTVHGLIWDFRQVKIAPLLAFQLDVAIARADALCASVGASSPVRDLLPICLPQTILDIPNEPEDIPNPEGGLPLGVRIRCDDPNLRILGKGRGPDPIRRVETIGAAFGPSVPYVHVADYKGRCFLRNGYHRAYALLKAGLDFMPCLVTEVSNYREIGIMPNGTFAPRLLNTSDPPTCGHFCEERATQVALRPRQRVIEIRWTDTFGPHAR